MVVFFYTIDYNYNMKNIDKIEIKNWVRDWENAGLALEGLKKISLRSYNYEKNQKIVDELLQLAYDYHTVRYHSGLVEQQKVFIKLREKK